MKTLLNSSEDHTLIMQYYIVRYMCAQLGIILFTYNTTVTGLLNKGTHFVTAFSYMYGSSSVKLHLLTRNSSTVQIHDYHNNNDKIHSMVADSKLVLDMPTDLMVRQDVEDKTVFVSADVDISILVEVFGTANTGDMVLIFKVTPDFTRFLIATEIPNHGSQFSLAATEDGTAFTIFVSGKPLSGILNRGETFTYVDQTRDLTGSYVETNKPVSVMSGNQCTRGPVPFERCDGIVISLLPIRYLGTHHVIPPIVGVLDYGRTIKVVPVYDKTTVYIFLSTWEVLGEALVNNFLKKSISSTEIVTVVCSTPCMVVVTHNGVLKSASSNSDIFMMVVADIDHYVNDVIFSTPVKYSFTSYISIVAKTSAVSSMILDNQYLAQANWIEVPGSSGYSYSTMQIQTGYHHIQCMRDSCKNAFSVWVYGHKQYSSYGYLAGFDGMYCFHFPFILLMLLYLFLPLSPQVGLLLESCVYGSVHNFVPLFCQRLGTLLKIV